MRIDVAIVDSVPLGVDTPEDLAKATRHARRLTCQRRTVCARIALEQPDDGSGMAKKKIIFQGERGANSDLACREAYPDYEPVPCPTFEDCFSALSAGEVDLGMIPIENSVAGRVADIHHLMPTAKLHIIAEWFLPIRNQLMAPKGATLQSIKTVQSHVMALGQCRNSMRALEPQADRRRRHRRLGARNRRSQRSDARRHRLAAGRRNLRPQYPERERRGRVELDHPLRRAVAREEMGRAARERQGHHHLRVPRPQHSGGACTRRWAASPPTAST